MTPRSLALIDGDVDFSASLHQHLLKQGIADVRSFADSGQLLMHTAAFNFAFYIVELDLPGIDGVDLVRVLRRHSQAGVLVVSGRLAAHAFETCLEAGADMYLAKPVRPEEVGAAVKAVHRRVAATGCRAPVWTFDVRAAVLTAPDCARILLSPTDTALLTCFVDAAGAPVSRDQLVACLDPVARQKPGNQVHAAIYRLRRRIHASTPLGLPLVSQSGVGYVFREALVAV